jgi:hypothetical protein
VTLEDATSGPGVFSSRASHKETHRYRLRNSGRRRSARGRECGGLRYASALPKADRRAHQGRAVDPTSEPLGGRALEKRARGKGVVTWALVVPRGGRKRRCSSTQRIAYPDGATLHAR